MLTGKLEWRFNDIFNLKATKTKLYMSMSKLYTCETYNVTKNSLPIIFFKSQPFQILSLCIHIGHLLQCHNVLGYGDNHSVLSVLS
jgi:hypothetical protein